MKNINHSLTNRQRRKMRVGKQLHGRADRPRLSVYRSNKHICLQVIDDDQQQTIVSCSSLLFRSDKEFIKKTKTEQSRMVALKLAELLLSANISQLIFDRSHYKYHGRVKMVADTLREKGITI